jgi:thioredoxin reductase
MLDVVIAGAGPAGLNAALMLGRARRNVLLCDTGQPRNATVQAMHGLLSRDGTDPAALRRTAREQLQAYPTVRVRDLAIQAVTRDGEGFTVSLADGSSEQARRLLLATGVADQLPPIPGLAQLWGRGVFNCPYCDGFEVRDQPLAVLASDQRNLQLALQLTRYSPTAVPLAWEGQAQQGTGADDGRVRADDDAVDGGRRHRAGRPAAGRARLAGAHPDPAGPAARRSLPSLPGRA